MRLSIIIPVFNRWAYTKKCLEGLAQLDKERHEIIIFNNASSDQTKNELPLLCEKISNATLLTSETNLGHSAACNQGYAKATGNLICFLNNDIKTYETNWTDNLFKYFDNNDNCILGGSGGHVEPKEQFSFKYETKDQTKQINYLAGWCLTSNRNTFDKLIMNNSNGPWNNQFFFYYNDTDLGFRATQKGIKLQIIDLPITHIGKISVAQLNTFKLYNEGRQQFLKQWSKRGK